MFAAWKVLKTGHDWFTFRANEMVFRKYNVGIN